MRIEHHLGTPFERSEIVEFLKNNLSNHYKLYPDLSRLGERVGTSDKLGFIEITFNSNDSFTLEYELEWWIFNGCKDMDQQGCEGVSVCGTWDDKFINIDTSLLAQWEQ